MRAFPGVAASLVAASLALVAGCNPTAPANPPDAIFHGGTIYTGVDGQLPATAVSVKDGRIVEVGAAEELLKTAGEKTEKVDLGGAFLYPGFTDAHAHLYGIGEREADAGPRRGRVDRGAGAGGGRGGEGGAGGQAAAWAAAGSRRTGRRSAFPIARISMRVTGDRPTVLVRADGHAHAGEYGGAEGGGAGGQAEVAAERGRIEVGADGLPTGMLIDNADGADDGAGGAADGHRDPGDLRQRHRARDRARLDGRAFDVGGRARTCRYSTPWTKPAR